MEKRPPPEDPFFDKPGCPACEVVTIMLLGFLIGCLAAALSALLR